MTRALDGTMTFSDEQSMLLDTAVSFFRTKSPSATARDLLLSEHGYDDTIWQEMVALGWSGLAIGEAYGGSNLGLGAAASIAEPMGRHLSATPWLATQLFAQGLRAADEPLQQAWLPRVAEGSIGSVALTELDGSWDLAAVSTSITPSGDELTISGEKTFVLNADVAECLLVSGQADGGTALVLVRRDELGDGALTREMVIDETRRSFGVRLDGVRVPADRLIRGAAARAGLARIRDAALLLLSAEGAGGTAGVLDLVVEYLNTRTAFGRRIGSYQGLKHPTVDILVGLERSRSHLYHAASLLDAGEDAEVALRMAKAEVSDTFAFAGDRAVQFHGGFGFTWECDAQLFLRRALWLQYAFGDAAHHRKHLAGLIL